jgi:hypothetical protein
MFLFTDDSPEQIDPRCLPPEFRNVLHPNFIKEMRYPEEYQNLYQREKECRIFNGYDNLKMIRDEKVFIAGPEQHGKIRIQQVTNVNCIKSREQVGIDLKYLKLSQTSKNILKEIYNINYYNNEDEYSNEHISKHVNDFTSRREIENNEKLGPEPENPKKYGQNTNDQLESEEIIELRRFNFEKYILNKRALQNELVFEIKSLKRSLKLQYDSEFNAIKSTYPNKFDLITMIISYLFGPYKDHVCIAGGFSLSQYMSLNNYQEIEFGDIDLFIHSLYPLDSNNNPIINEETMLEANKKANIIVNYFSEQLLNHNPKRLEVNNDIKYLKENKNDPDFKSNIISMIKKPIYRDLLRYNSCLKHSSKSADETLIEIFKEIAGETIVNDNVVFCGECFLDGLIEGSDAFKPLKFQIIKRIYRSPSEIITGFDVDSCCILTNMDGEIYTTERGYYAIQKGYNTINFERLSPSYEYRLMKYNKRGFGIWIPFIEYFKLMVFFDINLLDVTRGSSILIKSLLKTNMSNGISDYNSLTLSRYDDMKDEYIVFKTLNPNEQVINTFHRLQLNDILSWYPKDLSILTNEDSKFLASDNKIFSLREQRHFKFLKNLQSNEYHEYLDILKYSESNIVEIPISLPVNRVFAKNLIRRCIIPQLKNNTEITKHFSKLLIQYIDYLKPNIQNDRICYILGDIVQGAIIGKYTNSCETTFIWSNILIDENERKYIEYHLEKIFILIKVCKHYHELYEDSIEEIYSTYDIDYLKSLGEIRFCKTGDLGLNVTEEQSFQNYHSKDYSFAIKKIDLDFTFDDSWEAPESEQKCSTDTACLITNKIMDNVNFNNMRMTRHSIVVNTDKSEILQFVDTQNEIINNEDRNYFKSRKLESAMYNNFKFYGLETETVLLINGISKREDILQYNVYENFIPVKL